MDVTTQMLKELLVESGVDPGVAAGLDPGVALLRQGVDSLEFPAFAMAVENRFGLAIDERSSMSLRSLDDFVAYLNDRLNESKAAAIIRLRQGWKQVESDRAYEVGVLKAGDGRGVAQLFYTVYGDRYPVTDYYIPDRIEQLNSEGKLLTVVARLDTGVVAGQGAYYQSSPPNKALFEFGQLMVAPEYRNSLMAAKINLELNRRSHTMTQAQGFFGEAVCTHLMTQKLIGRQGYSECGIEVSLMPAGAYEKEGAGAQRVSCVLGARVDRDRHMPLHLPECYRREMELILGGFALNRDIRFSTPDTPSAARTSLDRVTFDFANVERVQIPAVGADFPGRAREIDQEAKERRLAVLQMFINAGQPGTALAVESLRSLGFVLGGLVPLWFGPDGILMQKLYVEPEFETINLYSDKSKALLAFIRADWERARPLC